MKQRRRRKLKQRLRGASNLLRSNPSKKSFPERQEDILVAMQSIYWQHEALFKRLADS